MDWHDQIKPARFRGVAFHIETAERSGGRRTVKHEYPLRDVPFVEDMGRKAREFTVDGYVIGAEYFTAKNALIAVLEQAGPGELVHPYHGTRLVAVSGFRVRESPKDGGMARFSIDFVETPAQPAQPTAIVDTADKVATSAAAARASVGAEFVARYVTDASHKDSVAGVLRGATLAMNNVASRVAGGLQEIATMKRRIEDFEDSIETVVGLPEDIFEGLSDIVDLFESKALLVYDFAAGERPVGTSRSSLDEQTNYDETQRLVQRLAVVRAAELLPAQTFDSYDTAVAGRNEVADLLDAQAEAAADAAYPALLQLRSDIARAVPGVDSDLPRLVEHTPAFTVPSLVLAHSLYGHLDLEADLLARNAVKNPFLVPGAVTLEVLSDDD